jgi:VCBS repeat-containing protein
VPLAPCQRPLLWHVTGLFTGENTALSIPASALLASDTDPNGLPLSVTGVSNPSNGTVSFDPIAQTVTFVPTAGYIGPAGFTYTVTDGRTAAQSANVALTVTYPPPVANNVSGFVGTEHIALSIPASALVAADTDPNGLPISIKGVSNPIDGTVSYDPNSQAITFVPSTAGTASFTYTATDALGGMSSAQASITVNNPPTAETLFSVTDTPANVTVSDNNSVELGVKFQALTNGVITGIRFYKGPQNTGTHAADLWSDTGTLLATGTFTNETTSGWQQVDFTNPVSITAGTTYVASYHTSGNYSADSNYFAVPHASGFLTAPASNGSDGDGVYAYGTGSVFPTNTYNASNYWVDVVFEPGPFQPPVANDVTGLVATENTADTISASALLANDTDPNGLPLSIAGVSNPSNGTVTYNSSTQTISFVPTTGYTGPASFTYTVIDGQASASGNVALTVNFPPPIANNVSGLVATENTSDVISASTILASDTDPNGFPLSITSVGNASNGTVSYDANAQAVTFVPTTGYSGTASFTYSISNGHGGTASASVGLLVTDPSTVSLFSPTSTPSIVNSNDLSSAELGMEFQASENGEITGLRFYKGPQNTGSHVADLWSATGTLLATATFTNETASGWQQVNFTNPVAITAGTTYVASYHTSGDYSVDPNLFATALTSGLLTAPAGAGLFAYGSSSLFPNNSVSNSYGVDVVFNIAGTAVAVADTASATEAGGIANATPGVNPTGNVLANDTGDGRTVSAVAGSATNVGTAVAGTYGSVTINSNGSYTYTVDNSNRTVQGLRTSTQTLTDTFTYTMTDAAGATSSTTLTVTIQGADDAPVAVADTASATEAGGIANATPGVNPTGNVLTNDTDVDTVANGETETVQGVAAGTPSGPLTTGVGSTIVGSFGSLVLNADGSYTYTVNNSNTTVQGLRTSTQTLTDTFTYTMTDAVGVTSSTTLTVTIHGADDAPVTVADTASATEAGGIANATPGVNPTGNVLTNDTDVDTIANGETETVQGVAAGTPSGPLTTGVGSTVVGSFGSLVLNADGSYTYTVNNSNATVQGLRTSTQTLTDTFTYTMMDAAGATSTTTLTVTIHGADDAPVVSNVTVSATSISFVATDPDNATLSLASPFASAFGNPVITSGATTTLTPIAQTTAVSGTLQVTDGTYTADVIGLYVGTAGNNTATAPNPTGPNAMYGFGGSDTLTGGAAADSIFGGAGADTLSGGAGNDTFYLANGDFASGESIDGGAGTDSIVLTNATTADFTSGTVSNVETLTGSSGNDTVTMSATQWTGFSTINLGSGTNVLNVVASGNISALPTPALSNVTTGSLIGTAGNDTITLTGAQLDAIIIGGGTINLGAGTDTINLISTSADLNTLGATNASIQGVEAISAATASAGVTITLSGQTEGFTITGSANNDVITGGRGADTITGGAGVDRFVFNSGSSPGTVGGTGNNGTITGYDVITDFSANAGGDILDMPNVNVAANGTVNGTDSTLTIGGQTIKSHNITNGIITFSNNNTFASGTTFSLTSLANVAAAVNYIHNNDFAPTNAGANIAFVANIGGTAHTYVFNQVGSNPNTNNDILVDLVGVTLTSLSGANLAPAGVAGEAINLGLTNPTDHLGSITVNISGVPSGWTINEGTDNGDGTWSVQTSDVSALSITAPENNAGAVSLQISQTWTDSTGGTELAMITNNVEAYAPSVPIFAISGDDNLSGSSGNDVFVLAQPIGNDTIHSFDAAHDTVDLIGFSDLSSFVDVRARLSENSHGDAVITIAQGESITFAGVSAESLTANNFIFNRDTVMSNANSIVIGDNAVLPLAGTINNSGTIELASTGGQARLQVLANGLALEGGGHVELSDGNGNIIAGTTPDATLTNVDNTISGAGQLGEGQLTLHNQGTVIASGSNTLTIDTGAAEVINSGTLRATGSGGLVIHSDIANSGLLWANGGNITTDGNVSGTGSALIDGETTFEMGGTFSENVTLEAGAKATLRIDHAADFRGTVAGFDGNDLLDLADLAFGGSTTLGYAANSNNTGGTLTASDGTHTATIALLGQYTAASFVMSADSFGGTLIHDVTPATLTPTLTPPQHA